MHFGNPHLLYLLPVWVLLAILGGRALAWRTRVARRIGQPELVDRLYPAAVRRWRRRRLILALAALLLLIIAATRPQYGKIERSIHSVGTNVLIALDCSGSMDADDVPPTRLEAAKRSLEMMLHRLTGNRTGIIAFAGEALLQCPMTLDQEMTSLVLSNLDTEAVNVGGTDLGAAIDVAATAFDRGAPEGGRALVLITDGEDLEGKAAAAAKRAKEKKVRIYAIGIGTSRGTPLLEKKREPLNARPDAPPRSSAGGFKEDPTTGNKVNTRLRMDTLEEIARLTGGTAYAAEDAPALAVDNVAKQIETLQRIDLDARKQVLYQDRFQWFLAPALLLIFWMILLRPAATRLEQVQPASSLVSVK